MSRTLSPWRGAFWKSYWISLRRSGKDKRARTFVLRVSFGVLYLVGYFLVFFVLLPLRSREGFWQLALYGFIFGTGAIAFFILRRSHRKQDELLNFSLTGRNLQGLGQAEVPPKVRAYLERRALILAALVTRAASEIYLQHNPVRPGSEVGTRQNQNAYLRESGLWEKLEPAEAELVSAADGRWTPEQSNLVAYWSEQLRLLRWTLGIDAELVPLAHFPKADLSLASGLPRKEGGPPARRPLLAPSDLRVERDVAFAYTARVIAELNGRALIANSSDLEGWTGEVREKSLGASVDYLAGSETIGELSDEALRRFAATVTARARYAAYLVDQLSAEEPFSFATWKAAPDEL